jgi:hypothetical protein
MVEVDDVAAHRSAPERAGEQADDHGEPIPL